MDYKKAFTNKLIYGRLEECIQFQKIEMVCMSGEALLSGVARQSHKYKDVREFVRTISSSVFVGAATEELE